MQVVLRCTNLLMARRPDTDKVLDMIAPYQDLEVIEGQAKARSDNLLSLICAVTADAHREAGRYVEAAHWYRRSLQFRVNGGCVDYYADMVIEHQLADHYKCALDCVRRAGLEWKRVPWELRLFGYILSFWMRLRAPWSFRPYRALRRRSRTFESQLEQLLSARASNHDDQ